MKSAIYEGRKARHFVVLQLSAACSTRANMPYKKYVCFTFPTTVFPLL